MKKQIMKTFAFSCLIFLGLASVALGVDQYFFWQFNPDSVIEGLGNAWEAGARQGLIGYSTVNNPYNVMGHLQLYYDSGSGLSQADVIHGGISGELDKTAYLAKLDSDQSYYYFVELVNESGLMGYYSLGQYGDLQAYIASADLQILPESVWGESNYKPIPEPTSGLLLLLGVAGLALRRKARKA